MGVESSALPAVHDSMRRLAGGARFGMTYDG